MGVIILFKIYLMTNLNVSCSYAALILHTESISLSEKNLLKLLDVAGVKVESYWPRIYANHFSRSNLNDLITRFKGGAILFSSTFIFIYDTDSEAKSVEKKPDSGSEDMGFN